MATTEETLKASFETLILEIREVDILKGKTTDQRLDAIIQIMSRLDAWLTSAEILHRTDPQPQLRSCIDRFRVVLSSIQTRATALSAKARSPIRIATGIAAASAHGSHYSGSGDDAFQVCAEAVLDACEDGLEGIQDADGWSETREAIEKFGDDLEKAIDRCLDQVEKFE